MYNGIGLQTARGSGTNGYVQTNKFFIKPRSNPRTDTSQPLPDPGGVGKANKEILEHDRKRQIELRVLVLQETLADQGYTDSEIAEKVVEVRRELEMEHLKSVNSYAPALPSSTGRFSDTQTHQVAARKEKQLETMRAALGIKSPDEQLENLLQEKKSEKEIYNSDNEESDIENNRLQKKESIDHTTSDIEEGEFIAKGNQIDEDFKSVKDSKKDMKYWERKKGDAKAKNNYNSDSDIEMGSKKGKKNVSKKSEPDSYSSEENVKKHTENDTKKRRRRDTDSESDSDLDIKRSRKQRVNHKRSESDSDSASDHQKKDRRKAVIEHKKHGYNEKKHGVNSEKLDKFGKMLDTEDGYSKSEDERRSMRKEMEKSSKSTNRRYDTCKTGERDEKHESNSRKKEVASVKTNREVIRSRKGRHDSDDERSDSKDKKRTIKGKQKYKNTSSSSSSESDYSSDTDSDDNRYKSQTKHSNQDSAGELEVKRESERDKSRINDRYEPRCSDREADASNNTERIRKREVEESVGYKEREKEKDSRPHANRNRSTEDQSMDTKEKQVVKEERNDGMHGRRRSNEDEVRYDDTKRRRYDSYEHKYKEDSGRHRRG